MGRHLFRFLALVVIIGALVSVTLAVRKNPKKGVTSPVPIFASTVTPAPTSTTDILAPNGKVTLTMKEKRVENGIVYTFFVSGKEIFSKNLSPGNNISIPFNTFSPDNKYIFLKEVDGGKANFFVVPTAGGDAIDVSGPFGQKFGQDFEITDVTGWGGLDLLVINANGGGGGKASFWFEVPTRSFIRLSHNF